MAEYKLFRSLAIVFVIDAVIAAFSGLSGLRIAATFALSVMAFWRFAFLLHWTYRIAFEYFVLVISSTEVAREGAAA